MSAGRMSSGVAKNQKEVKTEVDDMDEDSKAFSKELARLQFFSAGKNTPGIPDGKSMKVNFVEQSCIDLRERFSFTITIPLSLKHAIKTKALLREQICLSF